MEFRRVLFRSRSIPKIRCAKADGEREDRQNDRNDLHTPSALSAASSAIVCWIMLFTFAVPFRTSSSMMMFSITPFIRTNAKIVRESVRERGCQDVLIWVVSVSEKKTK